MTNPLCARAVRVALIAAGSALAAATAQATPNLTIAIGTCPAATLNTLQTDIRLTNGGVQKPGRNPPSRYLCDVIDDFAAPSGAPSWNTFQFQFVDRNTSGSRHMTARLMARAISSNRAREIARVTSTLSPTLRSNSVALTAPLNFASYDYYVIVDLTTTLAPVDAVAVRLLTR